MSSLHIISRAFFLCAISIAPNLCADVDRDFRLGKGLYNQQFFERAIAPLERVRVGSPSPEQLEETLFLLGEAYRSGGEFAKAADRFGELVSQFPRSQWRRIGLVGRGECLVRLEKYDAAVAALDELLGDPGPERATGLYWLAEAHNRRGETELAVSKYRSLLEELPDHALAPFAAYNAGLLLRDADRAQDGLDLLGNVDLPGAPAEIGNQLYLLRGDLALAAGEPQRAIADYGQVQGELMKSALAGTCWAARALGELTVFETARTSLRQNFADSAESVDVDLLLGAWQADEGRVEAADGVLAPHERGDRGNEARYWRAWARLRAEQPAEAARVFRQLSGGADSWSVSAAYHLEGELRRAKEWTPALAAADDFLKRHGADERCAEVLAGATESAYRLAQDQRVMELEAQFQERFAEHELTPQVVRFSAESGLRAGELDHAITRFESLWRRAEQGGDVAGKAELGPRLAWSLFQKDPGRAAARIAPLFTAVRGAPAAEVGILLGRSFQAGGNRDAALGAFRAAAAADRGGDAGTRAVLEEAVLLAAEDDGAGKRAAEQAYRRVIGSAEPGAVRGRATIDLAELLAARGDYSGAIPYFRQYIAENPSGEFVASAQLGLGFSSWRESDLDSARAAVAELQELGAAAPVLAEATYLEGRVRAEQEDLSGAMAALERYLEETPDGPREVEVLRELARVEEQAEQPESARAHLEQLVTTHPQADGADEALYRLAWLQNEAQLLDESRTSFEKLVTAYPRSAYLGDAHYRLADFAYEAEDFPLARKHYGAALASPDSERLAERARFRLGWSWAREEEWSQAQAAFADLAAQHPDGELAGEALFLAADAAGRRDNGADERGFLEQFVAGHPRHELVTEGKVRLAELLTRDREWNRVRQLLDPLRAATLPGDLEPRQRVALGRALVQLGAARAAVTLLEDALKEGKAIAAEAQFEMGFAHRALGDRQRAIEVFINGPVLYPFRPWAIRSYLEAGRDLQAAGKKSEAVRVLNLAIKEDPEGEWGKEARRLLDSGDGKGL